LVFGCSCGGGGGEETIDARPHADARPGIDANLGDAGTASLPEELPDPMPTGDPDLTVVMYNMGIIATVKGPAERLPLIRDGLKGLDVDVICMAECYRGPYTNPEAFAAELADVYPYSYWTETGKFASYNGLLIVSKHPLYRGREVYYSQGNDGPQTVDRMGIGVTVVDKDGEWYANVMCTHQHAGLDPAGETTNSDIRSSEITELTALGTEEGYYDGPTFMLGDYNSGPGVPPEDCECETTPDTCDPICRPPDMTAYGVAISLGWTDPFPTDPSPFWTSGREQYTSLELIPGLYPAEPSQRIDHCFYRNLGTSVFKDGGIELDDPVDIEVEGLDGPETIHYLSDHYPVSCTFGPP